MYDSNNIIMGLQHEFSSVNWYLITTKWLYDGLRVGKYYLAQNDIHDYNAPLIVFNFVYVGYAFVP